MANIGYIQMVRHCNQNCGFCSNPETPFFHNLEQVHQIVDDFVSRDYFGVIMTGGEPTLSPILPEAIAHARANGLHVRMITNGQKLADWDYCKSLADAGLQHVHVSIHSHKHKLEDFLTGTPGSLDWAEKALTNLGKTNITVNINTVITTWTRRSVARPAISTLPRASRTLKSACPRRCGCWRRRGGRSASSACRCAT